MDTVVGTSPRTLIGRPVPPCTTFRKRLGSGDTPAVSQASDHAAYDEEEDLSTTDELQFVNGRFRASKTATPT